MYTCHTCNCIRSNLHTIFTSFLLSLNQVASMPDNPEHGNVMVDPTVAFINAV